MNTFKTLALLVALVMSSAKPVQAGDASAERLTGGSWNVNYANDSCRLVRSFGQGPDTVTIRYEWFSPNLGGYELMVTGKRFEGWRAIDSAKLAYGPDGPDPVEFFPARGTLQDGTPLLLFSGGPKLSSLGPTKLPSELRVIYRRAETQLLLGNMSPVLGAVQKCLDELVTHWGLDPAQQQAVVTPPRPIGDPADWLDYPASAQQRGQQAVVHIRLTVDASGKVTDCAVQSSIATSTFRTVACRNMLTRARFKPGEDAAGKPVASYYINAIRWISGW